MMTEQQEEVGKEEEEGKGKREVDVSVARLEFPPIDQIDALNTGSEQCYQTLTIVSFR